MKVVRDDRLTRFQSATAVLDRGGVRIKDVRATALNPGGRCRLTLFEAETGDDRAHPRLRTEMPPTTDPAPPTGLFKAPAAPPTDADALRRLLSDTLRAVAPQLLPAAGAVAPKGSEQFFKNSVRVQRTATLFSEISAWVEGLIRAGTLTDAAAARRVLRSVEAEAYAGVVDFDNANTGTYHSYQHDAPFVHYLEQLLSSLPEEGSAAFAILPPEQQESLLRQRKQTLNHLDHLMRFKYANEGIAETDIERSLGGLLIDRETRHIVSETPASQAGLVPAYELLRVDPGASHPAAGAWVYRDNGVIKDETGKALDVPETLLRSVPLTAQRLTFKRAPGDPRLRHHVRLDWDRNGYVTTGKVSWVSWAGHCDIKAIMEQLGLALVDHPPLVEHRADTGQDITFNRDLLIEMIASAMELGSVYKVLDGSGQLRRGRMRFGGARNDSLPDRLQFKGTAPGASFRFPLAGRRELFKITKLREQGKEIDVEAALMRYTPDLQKIDFAPNPRFLETVENDYNVIDISGMTVEVEAIFDEFDPRTGYPSQGRRPLTLDLAATRGRVLIGSQMRDPAKREVWEYFLNFDARRVEADAVRWVQEGGAWKAGPRTGNVSTTPLLWPLKVTLSREMKRDDPALFQSLLEVALRQAQNINADTSEEAEVWNGTVTRITANRTNLNEAAGVERWRVEVVARFGSATLDYLLRRGPDGLPSAYCPVPNQGFMSTDAPDFLWQEFPDVGSKGKEGAYWVVNQAMADRGIVELRAAPSIQGGTYVYDDHIKNVFEILFCALGDYRYTIVHNNKRWGFKDEAAWKAAKAELATLRAQVRFEGQGGGVA